MNSENILSLIENNDPNSYIYIYVYLIIYLHIYLIIYLDIRLFVL